MSAPLVINLRDGSVWERRAVTAAGVALYALAGSCKCPEFLMASESELAAQGIAGTADVLPVPVAPEPSERDRLRAAFVEALENAHHTHPCPVLGDELWTGCVHYDEAGRVAGVGSCHSGRRADAVLAVWDVELERLRARVAELEAERHSTNEALDDAVQALRLLNTQRGDADQLVEAAEAAGEDCVDVGDLITALALGTEDERAEAGGR